VKTGYWKATWLDLMMASHLRAQTEERMGCVMEDMLGKQCKLNNGPEQDFQIGKILQHQ